MKTFIPKITQQVSAIVCDKCGFETSASDVEFHEFISIQHRCGYASIHEDGSLIEADLCQNCFAQMCSGYIRFSDELNSSTSDIESDNTKQAASELLSQNRITNAKELAIALQRVDQLWQAQLHSAAGKELNQLFDLICTYEKKDWNSFFENTPKPDDDFMIERE